MIITAPRLRTRRTLRQSVRWILRQDHLFRHPQFQSHRLLKTNLMFAARDAALWEKIAPLARALLEGEIP